jgi:hypothetical protein
LTDRYPYAILLPIMPVVDSIPAWLPTSPFEPADAGRTDAAAAARPTSPSSPSTSDIPHPTSHIDPSPFPDLDPLADTLLSEIAAGFQSLASIAAAHHIPYAKFTLWLLQPATQQKLADLSAGIAAAARLTATAALPDIVRGLKTTLEHLNAPAHAAVAPPGADPLRAQALTLRRHRAVISASALLYRIARFTPTAHRATDDSRGAASSVRSRQRRSGLAPLPRHDLPDFDGPPSTSPQRPETRAPEGARHRPPIWVSPLEDCPASDLEPPMPLEEAIQNLREKFDLTDEQVAELRASPRTWLREHLHEFSQIPFVFDDSGDADDG